MKPQKNWGKKTKAYQVSDVYFDNKTLAKAASASCGEPIKEIVIISKKIKTSSAKSKGRELQKWVAERIGKLLDLPVGKDELIESREMGQSGSDVKLIGEAGKRFPFGIECKNAENWSILSYIQQAKANTKPGHDWLVIMKKNGIEPLVLMDAAEWFEWMEGHNL